MKKIFTWLRSHWIFSLVTIAILGGGYYYFTKEDPSDTPITRMQVETVAKGDLSIAVSGTGQIQADSQVDLKPVAAGDAIEVTSVLVKNDQEVTEGQIIAILDNEDARRDVDRARLDLRRAEIQLKQKEDLFPKETKDDKYERQLSEASVTQSRIALAESQERLNDYTIRAPFDGIVTGLAVDSGDTVSQTGILASVITKTMKAVITLNEVDASSVRVGNAVTLTFDALPNDGTTGKITKIDTIGTAEQGVVSYGAEISLDEQNPNLKPGMSVSAEISISEKKDVLLVPNAAITYEDGKAYVQIAPNRQAGGQSVPGERNQQRMPMQNGQKKEITVGMTDNVNTEVVSGLNENDRIMIITAGAARTNGQSQGSGGFLFGGTPRGGGGNFDPR